MVTPAALWAASFVYWTLSGLLSAANYHNMAALDGSAVTWAHALRTSLVATWLWVPLTVFVFWLAGRHPIERGQWRRGVAIHLAGGLAVVLIRAVSIYVGDPWVGWYTHPPTFLAVVWTSIDHNLLLYWLFVGLAHGLHAARKSRERELDQSRLEAQLAQARLETLAAQLHPHFLFNTLHSLAELVHRDAARAERMIVSLSELLRKSLADDATAEMRLADELELLEAYLEIEQIRYGERLRVHFDVDPEAGAQAVPRWILQPLVENALRHGLEPRAAPGRLEIAAARRGEQVVLEVRDDGVGLPPGAPPRLGIGLGNTRERLFRLYGDAASLSIERRAEGGTTVRLELPWRALPAGVTGAAARAAGPIGGERLDRGEALA
jgi:signal transduction histidine kinase